MVKIKEWRKMQWSGKRGMITLRKSELLYANMKEHGDYEFLIEPEEMKMTITFREAKNK